MGSDTDLFSPKVAYESSDVPTRRIALIAGTMFALVLLAILAVSLPFFTLKNHRSEVSPKQSPEAATGWREPPQPRLQASPELDLQGYTAGYDRALSSYSWVDRAHGIASIPIDRAIEIAAGRGIPRTAVNPSLKLSQPRQGSTSTGFQGKVVDPPQ